VRLILQRYILLELLKAFVLSTAAITLFLAIAYALSRLRERGLGPSDSVSLVLYFIPAMLVFAMPIGALLTSTLVYGRLAHDNEITACRASGVSMATLLRPVLVLGLLIGVMNFVLFDRVIPWARARAAKVGTQNVERIFFHSMRTQMHVSFRDFFISANYVQDPMLYGVVLRTAAPDGQNIVGYAPAAMVKFLPAETAGAAPAPPPAAEADRPPTQEEVAARCWDASVVTRGRLFLRLFGLDMFDEGKLSNWGNYVRGSPSIVPVLRGVQVTEPVQMTLGELRRAYARPEEAFRYQWEKESRGDPQKITPAQQAQLARSLRTIARWIKACGLAEMQSRYASMVSGVLLVVLGAVLGIRFRHGHILTAFFISMGPALFAIFAILMGARMVKEDPAHMHNLVAVIWAGNIVVLVIDMIVVGRLMRQ